MVTKKKQSAPRHQVIPIWEWVVAGLGSLLLLGIIGFAVYRIANGGNAPPEFSIEVESVVQSGEMFLASVRVTNSGDETAAALEIEGKLLNGETDIETSTATLTYAPANSTRKATMIFSRDPRDYRLALRPVGFEKP